MNNEASAKSHIFACPQNDQSLFNGSFSGRLRELALGSSRSDALSAVRRSRLKDWVVDDSGATLEVFGTRLVIKSRPSPNEAWVTGTTPHGTFSLPADHWIAQQLYRRLDRRTQGFALQLQETASKLFKALAAEAFNEVPRSWRIVPEQTSPLRAMHPSTKDPLHAGQHFMFITVGVTELGNGFSATLNNLTLLGTRTGDQALRDYLVYCAEARSIQEPWRIPLPKPAGPYKDEHLTLDINYTPLDQLRSALGLKRQDIPVDSGYHIVPLKMIWLNSGLSEKN